LKQVWERDTGDQSPTPGPKEQPEYSQGQIQATPAGPGRVFITACVAGKEFSVADVIKMEKAGMPVLSKPEPGGRCPGHHVPASKEGEGT